MNSHRPEEFADTQNLQKYQNQYFDQFLNISFLIAIISSLKRDSVKKKVRHVVYLRVFYCAKSWVILSLGSRDIGVLKNDVLVVFCKHVHQSDYRNYQNRLKESAKGALETFVQLVELRPKSILSFVPKLLSDHSWFGPMVEIDQF